MFLKRLPWKYLVRRLAHAHGFLDPASVLARLERFAQPSEVMTPVELLRAGAVFHARGLMNTKAIQHNLDWVWPFWVQRQFDPADPAFVPRAFSITHVNLTHRNWTAVGLPDCAAMPIVDPHGLLTPFFDGWSIDAWIIPEEGDDLLPSCLPSVLQNLRLGEDNIVVETQSAHEGQVINAVAQVEMREGRPTCRATFRAGTDHPAWLAISLRPFNPEGVSFIHEIALDADRQGWSVDRKNCVRLSQPAERHVVSRYTEGDVHLRLLGRPECDKITCEVGLASAAALYALRPGDVSEVSVEIDLTHDSVSTPVLPKCRAAGWRESLEGVCRFEAPDPHFQFLYDAALRSLVLLSPLDVYPGPYTYKRFWFRDAAVILHAMLCAGMADRSYQVIRRFAHRQRHDGYFLSQAGEWDSNGEVLWILRRYVELTGRTLVEGWRRPVITGAKWIQHKRCKGHPEQLHDGLLPAGFSAEHLGNNDYYYWDDLWGVAGLRAAAELCEDWGRHEHAGAFRAEADDFMAAIERSLERSRHIRHRIGIPASPYRRMDSGAVGSIIASYPLTLWSESDERIVDTVAFLLEHCMVKGAFFQDLIHSGLNAYLTLHVAQAMLRAGDDRCFDLVQTVADLASPTGQWPEAINPRTGGGCMGDGQHLWATAEWVMMVRNLFIREEGGALVLASGVPRAWLEGGRTMRFGPAPTPWGPVEVTVRAEGGRVKVSWRAEWRGAPPPVEVRLCDGRARRIERGEAAEVTL